MEQVHVDLLQAAPALAVIAGGTGGHHVVPDMLAALVTGLDVIDCKVPVAPAAVLAGIIVAPEDLPASQFDPGARPVDLLFETYDAGTGEQAGDGPDVAAAIHDQASLPCQDQTDGPPCRADVDRLEICIQDKDRLVHGASMMRMIILLFPALHQTPISAGEVR